MYSHHGVKYSCLSTFILLPPRVLVYAFVFYLRHAMEKMLQWEESEHKRRAFDIYRDERKLRMESTKYFLFEIFELISFHPFTEHR